MAGKILHELASNAALLLVLSFLYIQVVRRWEDKKLIGQILNGILFGAVAVTVMLNPMTWLPGVIFDTRSVVISVGALFGGPLVAAITFLMASLFRVWQGGAGALMGVLVSFFSAALGTAYYFWKRDNPKAMRVPYLYGFGVLVHLVMLVCTLALPGAMTGRVLADIALPVIIIYPLATLLLCLLISDREARISADRMLKESEERYRRIVDTANEGILAINDSRLLTFVNQKLADMLGYAPQELTGRKLDDFIHPEDREAYGLQMQKRRQGHGEIYEIRYVRKDGTAIWGLVSAAPLLDERGIFLGSFGMVTDITASKKAEQDLQRFFNLIPDLACIAATDGYFKKINPAWREVLGYSEQEMLSTPFFDLIHPDDRESTQKEVGRQLSGEATLSFTNRYRCKDGSYKWLEWRATPAVDQTLLFASARDVTERKRGEEEKAKLESQLRQAQKMEAIGTLAGGIAHDFNNILGAIMGYAELAQELAREGSPNFEELTQVLEAADRARKLVRQILTFSRKADPDMRPLSLNKSIRQALQLLSHSLPKMIAIETHLAPDLALVNADPNQMEQVLMNLATNAADAMPEGGRLVIETQGIALGDEYGREHLETRTGRYVLLMVSDTGKGIDPLILEHIFDPFFTTKGVGKGTGLGLSTVYGIVKAHGGHVACYSEPGSGTTFKVYLPVYEADTPAHPSDFAPPEHMLQGSETILLVDDEQALRDLGARALEIMGYRVLTATNGEEALEIYRSQEGEIDLVVMDLGMPGMGGHKCLQEILAHNPQAKVVIASGYSANGQVKASLESGAAGFVAKPFRRLDLLATVRSALDRK